MAQELRAHAAVNPLTQGLADMAQSWARLAAELVPQVPELPGLIQQAVASLDGQDITEERLEAAARDIASHVEEAGYSAEAAQLLRRMGRAMYELLLVLATQEELRAMGMLLAVAPNPLAEPPRPTPPAPPPPRPVTPTSGPGAVSAPPLASPAVPTSRPTDGAPAPTSGTSASPAVPPSPFLAPVPLPPTSTAQLPQRPPASPPGSAPADAGAGPSAGTPPASAGASTQPVRAAQTPQAVRAVAPASPPVPAAPRSPGEPPPTTGRVSPPVPNGVTPASPPLPVSGALGSAPPSGVGPAPSHTAPRAPAAGPKPAAHPAAAQPPPVAAPAVVAPASPGPAPTPARPVSSSPPIPTPASGAAEGSPAPSGGAAATAPIRRVQEVPEADLWGFDPSEREPEPAVEVPPPGPALEVASTPVEPQAAPAAPRPIPGPGVWTVRLSPRRALARDRKVEARRQELKPLIEEIVRQVHEQRRAVSDRGPARQAVRAAAEAVPPADLAVAAGQLDDLLQAGQHERATALVLRVTEAFPGEASAELACRAGEACRAVKQDDLAVLDLTTAVLAAPPFEQACWQLAGMALENKDPQLAPIWLEFVARLLRVRGADEDAVVVYRQLVNLCPRRQDVRGILSSASLTGSLPD